MSQRLRIPGSITLPFGYRITVKQLPTSELVNLLGEDVMAGWVCESNTIYLDKSRPIAKRRADFAHELVHAVADWQAFILSGPHGDAKG